jgi:hypothetical protein
VIDCLTANGNPHPPVLQRIFWSFTEGAVATALLKVGGLDGLTALQAVSIIARVPYTVVICLMCKGLWDVLEEEYDKQHGIQPRSFNEWVTPLIDVLDYPTFSVEQAVKTASAIFVPWWYAGIGAGWADGINPVVYQAAYGVLFNGWIVLLIANVAQPGLFALAWVLYLFFACHMAYERSNLRKIKVRHHARSLHVRHACHARTTDRSRVHEQLHARHACHAHAADRSRIDAAAACAPCMLRQ